MEKKSLELEREKMIIKKKKNDRFEKEKYRKGKR